MKASLRFSLIGLLIFSFNACKDRLEEMNQNPNKLTEIPDDFLFTSAVRASFRERLLEINLNYSAQYAHLAVADSWNREVDKYNDFHLQGDVAERIYSLYRNSVKYVNEVIAETSPDGSAPNQVRNAMAHVISVVNASRLTDLFGDVPYFEAGLGKAEIYRPTYDKQEEIYADMVERLKGSYDILINADESEGYPGADPIYDNDLEKWSRFANSLRLRLAMRARFADPGKYNTIIGDCLNGLLIENNDQNCTLANWDSDRGELYNPWYNFIIERENGQYNFNLSELFINTLEATNDPRMLVYATPNSEGVFVGMPNGLTDQVYGQFVRSNAASPSAQWLARDQPLYLMNSAEIWFLKAEAALFQLGPGNANELYQMGIRKSMEMNNISESKISDYLENVPEATLIGVEENQFRQISTQMWIAFELNYLESYNNVRRTGYPVIEDRTDPDLNKGVTNGIMPSRLLYPVTEEKTVNGENLQDAIDRMGGSDKIDNRVWWDVRD